MKRVPHPWFLGAFMNWTRTVRRAGASFLVLTALSLASSNIGFAQAVHVTSSSPIEAKLAVIDAGSAIVQQSTIRAYGRLLDRADAKCPERRTMVADMAVKGTQLLAKEGESVSVREMLSAINESLEGEAASLGIKCSEVVALLVVMMSSD